jgi:TetR/AcrR family transcriptional regulator, fatty acid metabolism regulator protein
MTSEKKPDNPGELSFIEKARRAQIIEHTIDTIATLGYGKASLAQIAKRAGISKGVISYHFAGKEELLKQVIAEIFTAGATYMMPRIQAETTPTGRLRAYIESNVGFMRTHRKHILAIVEIVANFRTSDGKSGWDSGMLEIGLRDIERLLVHGQETGEFRDFAPRVMATAIRGAIDFIPPQMVGNEDLDLDFFARELVAIFDRATRRENGGETKE